MVDDAFIDGILNATLTVPRVDLMAMLRTMPARDQVTVLKCLKLTCIRAHDFESAAQLRDLQKAAQARVRSEAAVMANRTRKRRKAQASSRLPQASSIQAPTHSATRSSPAARRR